MELHQIRYFLAVERKRNFSRAAEICNITQPALTRAIQKLEAELGSKLFTRRPGRIELTELGRAVLPRLQQAYQDIAETRSDALEFARSRNLHLRLGVMCTIGPGALAGLVRTLHEALPQVDLTLTESRGTAIIAALEAEEIDIALVGLPRYPEQLEVTALFTEQYVVACPLGHRFAPASSVALAELDGEDYIERLNCEFDDHFEFANGEWPVELRPRYRSEREDWVQAMVSAGLGIAIMPLSLPRIPGIAATPLVAPAVSRTISVATLTNRPLPPAATFLRDLVLAQNWGGCTGVSTAQNVSDSSMR